MRRGMGYCWKADGDGNFIDCDSVWNMLTLNCWSPGNCYSGETPPAGVQPNPLSGTYSTLITVTVAGIAVVGGFMLLRKI